MLFLVHDDEGRISQANQVYQPKGYAELLSEHGMQHIALDVKGVVPIDDYYILKSEVTRRPEMELRVSKDLIAAGETDSAVIRGIPRGSRFSVVVEGFEALPLMNEIIQDTVLEFSAPTPGIYKITFEKFPYMVRTVRVVAQ